MDRELQEEIRKWDRAVSAEAARLIRNGTPPYEAIERAREIVSRERSGSWPSPKQVRP